MIDLNNEFESIVNGQPDILEHKNYDIRSPKTDIDYQITKEQYLTDADQREKEALQSEIDATRIPPEVFNCFKVVGPKDKLALYSRIRQMPWWSLAEIKQISIDLNRSNAHRLYWSGFQLVIDLILPIVHEEKLKQLINIKTGPQQHYSLLTVLLSSYLQGGFLSMVKYYTERPESPKSKDDAIKTVSDFIYNVFKYHLVKYLGLFDVFYRYCVSVNEGIEMDDVAGLGMLLQKLEYNALTPAARKVSDYGVPFKLIECYDNNTTYDKEQFDAYERHIDEQVSRLFQ